MMINFNLDPRVVLSICASLAALVGVTFFYSAWQWHGDWMLAHQSITARPLIATTDETTDMIAALPDEHLFGKSLSGSEVPITNLQLHVTGIVKVESEETGSFSKAYISISGQPSKIYQIGDSLPYGVKVYDITTDTVILENGGHLEKLPLPRDSLQFKPKNIQEHL